MFKRLVDRFLQNRHPWRKVGFSELSELYTSMLFRHLALSLIGIFVPIYLYELGFSITTIMLFYTTLFGIRIITDILSSFVVARFGPKHSMAISYVPQTIGLFMLASYEQFTWPLWSIAILLGLAAGLFFESYHVDFSKIKHSNHSGKEQSFMFIMEKLGSLLGPVVGGLVALFFGVQYAFYAAVVFFIIGMIPLFATKEPVRTRQKITFRGFPIRKINRDMISYGMMAVENNVCLVIWPLFVALYALKGNAYFQLGLITSIGVVVSIVSARAIGKLIDNKRGLTLFRYSLVINSAIHLIRPFVNSVAQVFMVNMANEAVTPGYRMPYYKGWYDKTDSFPGYRIVYVAIMESANSLVRAVFYFAMALITLALPNKESLMLAFIIGAISNYFISLQRFPALRDNK